MEINIRFSEAMPWLRRVVACLSLQRPSFDPRQVCGNLLWTVLHLDGFLSQFFCFPLSVSYHHCPILIFLYMFLYPEEQIEEGWKNAITYLLNYLITPWSRALLEKLTGLELVKKFPAFYGTRNLIAAFTSARHLSLS
jgi:hypothetical protein